MLPTLPESSEPIEIVGELDEFNPIETLLEDAVDPAHGCDAPARFIDFIDTLLASKPPDDVWLIEALRTTARPSPIAVAALDRLFRTGGVPSKKRARAASPKPKGGRVAAVRVLAPLASSNSPVVTSAPNVPWKASGASPSRKNKQQRCSVCKGAGHKSRTCTFRPVLDNAPMVGDAFFA